MKSIFDYLKTTEADLVSIYLLAILVLSMGGWLTWQAVTLLGLCIVFFAALELFSKDTKTRQELEELIQTLEERADEQQTQIDALNFKMGFKPKS